MTYKSGPIKPSVARVKESRCCTFGVLARDDDWDELPEAELGLSDDITPMI